MMRSFQKFAFTATLVSKLSTRFSSGEKSEDKSQLQACLDNSKQSLSKQQTDNQTMYPPSVIASSKQRGKSDPVWTRNYLPGTDKNEYNLAF